MTILESFGFEWDCAGTAWEDCLSELVQVGWVGWKASKFQGESLQRDGKLHTRLLMPRAKIFSSKPINSKWVILRVFLFRSSVQALLE